MSGFFGRHEHQMDEKGRVSLPAPFRREAESDRFVLLQWEAPSLTLFPEDAWERVQEKLLEFRRRQQSGQARAYVRWIASNAVELTPDKQGRILIPAWLQEAGSLEDTALLVGAIDRIEIWNPELFAKSVREPARESEQFAPQIFD